MIFLASAPAAQNSQSLELIFDPYSLAPKMLTYGRDLPKLIDDGNDNNYGEWRIKSYFMLRAWDLWKYIEGPESAPPILPALRETVTHCGIDDSGCMQTFYVDGNHAEYQQKIEESKPWMDANNLALTTIVNAVPSSQIHVVENAIYAKQAWESLRSVYQPINSVRAARIEHEIKTYRCPSDADADMAKWLNGMQRLYNSLRVYDTSAERLSERDFVGALLDNMPLDISWRYFVYDLRHKLRDYESQQPTPTPVYSSEFFNAIQDRLLSRSGHNPQIRALLFSACADDADKTVQKKRTRAPDTDAASTSGSAKRRRTRRGSSDKYCTNPNCGVPNGHKFANCVAYGGGSQGQYSLRWKGCWNIHLPAEQRTKANNVPPVEHPAFAQFSDLRATYAPLSRSDTSHSLYTTDDEEHIRSVLSNETPGPVFW